MYITDDERKEIKKENVRSALSDISYDKGVMFIEVLTAGLTEEQLSVTLNNDVITVTGEDVSELEDVVFTQARIPKSKFSSSFKLSPEFVDQKGENITISLDYGILQITVFEVNPKDTITLW